MNMFDVPSGFLQTLKCARFIVKFRTLNRTNWRNFENTSLADDVVVRYVSPLKRCSNDALTHFRLVDSLKIRLVHSSV